MKSKIWDEQQDSLLRLCYYEGDLDELSRIIDKDRIQITARAHYLHLRRNPKAIMHPKPLETYGVIPAGMSRIDQIDEELKTCTDLKRMEELIRERSALAKRAKTTVTVFEVDL